MYWLVRGVYPPEKTKIVSEWGDEIAVIPHYDHIADQRKGFEHSLLETVREARQFDTASCSDRFFKPQSAS